MITGAKLVKDTVDLIISEKIDAIHQSKFINEGETLHSAPKIFREDCRVNWNGNAKDIHNHVRGLSPYPGAWSNLRINASVSEFKIFETKPEVKIHNYTPGTILTNNKNELKIAVNDGYIHILNLQVSGKKRMDIKSFLAGNPISVNAIKL